jgi:processing peptidase subunit beta
MLGLARWLITASAVPLTSFLLLTAVDVAESIGRELLVYGRRIPKAEMFARIDAVDADTVRAVADRFIYDQDVAIAAVGDTQFLPDYNWFRRRTYWIRY